MTLDEKETIEKRIDTISTTVDEFMVEASTLGETLLKEKLWRIWFLRIAVILAVGLIIVGTLLVIFISKLQTVADEAAKQSKSNGIAIQANQNVLDQIQECNDPLSECSKKRDEFIRFAQAGIIVDNHKQIEQLREDFKIFLGQVQRGEAISEIDNSPSTTTTIKGDT